MKLDRLAHPVGAVVRLQHLLLNAKAFAGVVVVLAALISTLVACGRTDRTVQSS
jgi:hypothetical protein